MTNLKTRSSARDTDQSLPLPTHLGPATPTAELASYVQDLVGGLRSLTQQSRSKDLAFLVYLLALAELEARKLSSRIDN